MFALYVFFIEHGTSSGGNRKGGSEDLRYIHLFECIARCQKYCQLSLKKTAILNLSAGSKIQYTTFATLISHAAKPFAESRLKKSESITTLVTFADLFAAPTPVPLLKGPA